MNESVHRLGQRKASVEKLSLKTGLVPARNTGYLYFFNPFMKRQRYPEDIRTTKANLYSTSSVERPVKFWLRELPHPRLLFSLSEKKINERDFEAKFHPIKDLSNTFEQKNRSVHDKYDGVFRPGPESFTR